MSEKKQPRKHPSSFKAKVAIEAIKGLQTMTQISSDFGIHTSQIEKWKTIMLKGLPRLFENRESQDDRNKEALIARLYQQIGQLKVELDWLEKKVG